MPALTRLNSAWLPLAIVAIFCGFGHSLAAQEKSSEQNGKEADAQKADPNAGKPIFIANADGSDMQRLTDLPEYQSQGSPCWSQDGKLIAFDAWRPQQGEKNYDAQIVLVNADGSSPRVLSDGAMPSFSPKAKRIAFSRYSPNSGVWVMSAEGPDQELVLLDERGWGADWSPNGKEIVFSKRSPGGANFVVFNLIEGTRRYLFPGDGSPYTYLYWNFTWSPDSRQIVFKGRTRDGDENVVGIVDARGSEHGHSTLLVEGISPSFAWRPDGKRVLFSRKVPGERLRRIEFFDPDTEEAPQPLTKQDGSRWNLDMAYSPDGKKLAISSRKPPPRRKQAEEAK